MLLDSNYQIHMQIKNIFDVRGLGVQIALWVTPKYISSEFEVLCDPQHCKPSNILKAQTLLLVVQHTHHCCHVVLVNTHQQFIEHIYQIPGTGLDTKLKKRGETHSLSQVYLGERKQRHTKRQTSKMQKKLRDLDF